MNNVNVIITEPGAAEISVPAREAARIIRAWFCTSGAPKGAVTLMRASKLLGRYRHNPPATVRYRHVPAIRNGESLADYAERVTDHVNAATGRAHDEQLHLWAEQDE